MVLTKKQLGPGDYEIIEEGQQQVLRINYLGVSFPPSIEHSKACMDDVVEKLMQTPSVSRILLSADRNYIYDEGQTQLLREVANLYVYLTRQKKVLSGGGFSIEYLSRNPSKLASVQYIVSNLLKNDPIGAYVELKRMMKLEDKYTRFTNFREKIIDRAVNEINAKDENGNKLTNLTVKYGLLRVKKKVVKIRFNIFDHNKAEDAKTALEHNIKNKKSAVKKKSNLKKKSEDIAFEKQQAATQRGIDEALKILDPRYKTQK